MKLTLKLVGSTQKISKEILAAFIPDITKDMEKSIKIVKAELPKIVNSLIVKSSEYQSLLNGSLRLELGIPDASTKIAGLISLWSNNINYVYTAPKISGNQIVSYFSVYSFKSDFSDVLGTEYAIVIDSLRGYSLPWLEWLLLKGNTPIIDNHRVVFGYNRRSRTGQAIMRQDPRKSWKVPAQYAGTIDDNWITRAINSSTEIDDLLDKAFL